jgi:hypothetical protein
MQGILSHFRCVRLRVTIRAAEPLDLPAYKGSTLRGALGVSLKRLCCAARRRSCESCSLRFSCLYVYLFETPLSAEGQDAERYRNAPHPFVLQVKRDAPLRLGPGDEWSFQMTVVGRAIEWLPFVAAALRKMGELGVGKGRGRFDLVRIAALNGTGVAVEILYNGESFSFPSFQLDANGSVPARWSRRDRFRVRFLTPLRLVFRGELVRAPEFHILAGHLARRLELLERFHCRGESGLDTKAVIEAAREVELLENSTRWYDWERYSHRQGRKMRLGGLVGEAVYRGDPSRFEPLLTLGNWVNVGKNTSFGLGRYEVD